MAVWLVAVGKEYKWMKKQGIEDEVIIDGPTTLSVVNFAPLSELEKKTFPFPLSYSGRRRRREWCNNSIKKERNGRTNLYCGKA